MKVTSNIKLGQLQIGYTKSILPYDLDVTVPAGAFVAVMGVNGRGKSTLLKTMMGFLEPISGQILLNNVNIEKYSQKQLANLIAVVLTESVRLNNITVEQLIAFGRYPFVNWLAQMGEEDKKQIRRAAELCGILPLMRRQISQLSDGEKQKVLLARAIAQETSVLLLDEPTTHLDVMNKVANFTLLKDISKKEARTIVIASHELHYICTYCNYILLLGENDFYFDTPAALKNAGLLEKSFPGVIL